MTDCTSIRAWFTQALTRPGTVASATVAAHLAACALCRGALIELAASLVPLPAELPDRCDVAALAAFLDLEAEAGTLAVATELPGVWWHVWFCVDCCEAYAHFQTLREA